MTPLLVLYKYARKDVSGGFSFNFQSQETKSLESVAQFDRIAHIKYVLQHVFILDTFMWSTYYVKKYNRNYLYLSNRWSRDLRWCFTKNKLKWRRSICCFTFGPKQQKKNIYRITSRPHTRSTLLMVNSIKTMNLCFFLRRNLHREILSIASVLQKYLSD